MSLSSFRKNWHHLLLSDCLSIINENLCSNVVKVMNSCSVLYAFVTKYGCRMPLIEASFRRVVPSRPSPCTNISTLGVNLYFRSSLSESTSCELTGNFLYTNRCGCFRHARVLGTYRGPPHKAAELKLLVAMSPNIKNSVSY